MKTFALRRWLLAAFLAVPSLPSVAAPPISAADNFSTAEDTALAVPAATGVLANDNANGNAQIEAVLATTPAHGSVVLNADGSFTFTPAPDYNGADAFTYKARKVVPPLVFTINSAQSTATIQVTLHVSGINQTRSSNSRLGGTVTAGTLLPRTAGPFNLIQLTDVNATLLDAIALHYNIFLVGTADITSAPGAVTVTLPIPGPAAPVNASGVFSQMGNTLQANGIIHVKYNTIAGSSDADQPLDNVTGASDFNNSTIVSDGTTLTLTAPIDFTKNGVVVSVSPAVTADIHVTGTMKATAPAINNVAEESAAANVALTVTPVNDPPVAVAESYIARESAPMTIAAATAQSTEELVPALSVWKYRYDGQNLGTAWRQWIYNDASWSSGPAQLGFGDPEIVTNIRPGATPNYITAYFRRAFTVTNLSNTRPGAKLYVKRDDAAAVYLNGVEVYRDTELPAGAAFDTYATAQRPDAEENIFVEVPLNPALLFEGVNVLAAEVHQVTAASSDIRWDARLTRDIGAPGVLANDTDIDSPAASLSASVLAGPAHGSLSLLGNGGFTYTPAAGFIGADSFVYRVSDGGTPNAAPLTLLPRGSTWRYLADGTDQGVLWRATAFADGAWLSGAAELGYGDTADGRPEVTNIRPDPVNTPVYPTYYFRAHFTAPADLTFLANVRGRILRDDAAAIYINGVEVYRDTNLASGALFSDYATAGTPSETDYAEFAIPTSAIIAGDNVVAVEVHQVLPTSSDVSFDFELVGDIVPGARVSISVVNDDIDLDGMSDTWERANGFNYLSAADAATDADADGRSNRDEFLAGTNPNNPAQYLHSTSIARSGPDLVLGFTGTLAGRNYQLESSPNLATWTAIGAAIPATGPTLMLATPIAGDTRRFHRLRVLYTFP